ncbi:GAF domain-containing protein [Kordiimonas pumila]|uniref:GAF domain-containing protein n=1 Tax=Kordiimonas pumila TaxID=2161677 RepID=A0ABV7D8G5_9PROT
MNRKEKTDIYKPLLMAVETLLEGEPNTTAKMATVSCMLSEAFGDRFFWTGFYCVDPARETELVVGPYQGTLGCLRIAFGRGVCGTAAASGLTQIVDDVHAISNHITCDSRSNSEIVVPVWNADKKLIAVLDIDSTLYAAFDETDKLFLEDMVTKIFK